MPRTVEKAIAATRLTVGMTFRWRSAWWGIDEAPVLKSKYVYVDVGNEEPFRFPKDAQIRVRVTEPTARESYDVALDMLEGKLTLLLRKAKSRYQESLKELQEASNPNHWDFERYTSATKRYRIYSSLIGVLRHTVGSEPGTPLDELLDRADPGDLISAMEGTISELQREVWRYQPHSSSQWSNAEGQTQTDTAREWVDQFRPELDYLQGLAILVAKEEAQEDA
jgi:hypothetical protein